MNGEQMVVTSQARKVEVEDQRFLVGMEIPAHDYLTLTQDTLTDTWAYKSGGAAGTTVATIVITYTDSGKGTISTVAKT